MTNSLTSKLKAVSAASLFLVATVAYAAGAYSNSASYTGQGLTSDGFGGYDLNLELCGVQNGADAEGAYLLFVLTATGAANADITGPWGTASMSKTGNGTFKYVSDWYPPALLPGAVSATYDKKAKNAQLVVSHGCRPFTRGAWCSPGFWGQAAAGAWTLIGRSRSELFNQTVYDGFFGAEFHANALDLTGPTLNTVLTAGGGTYKGQGGTIPGTDPRTQAPNAPMTAFNATGAWLTDQIPGYTFDPTIVGGNESVTCPIDHFGNLK